MAPGRPFNNGYNKKQEDFPDDKPTDPPDNGESRESVSERDDIIVAPKIWPAHFMMTKRDFILRGSCFCENYSTFY